MTRSGVLFLVALSAVTGCASGPKPVTSPIVTITQVSTVEPIQAAQSSAVPVDYRLEVTNPFDHAVTLTSVEFETVGVAGGYTMKRVRHAFGRIIPPHSSDAIDLRAWVQPLQMSDRGEIVTPVMLRGIARFVADGKVMQTAFAGHAAQKSY